MIVGGLAAIVGFVGVLNTGEDDGVDTVGAIVPDTSDDGSASVFDAVEPPSTEVVAASTIQTASTTQAATTSTAATTSIAISTTTVAAPIQEVETAEQFVDDVLVVGLRSGELGELFDRLHPEVLSVYGVDACRVYLPTVVDPELVVIVAEVGQPEQWDWLAEGAVISIDEAIPVAVSLTAKGQTVMQELHLVDIDGKLYWFTDCGEPLDGSGQ